MAHGSRLLAHASRIVPRGSWIMATANSARVPQALGPRAEFALAVSHEPWTTSLEAWAMGLDPWTMSHAPLTINSRWIKYLPTPVLKISNVRISKIDTSKIQNVKTSHLLFSHVQNCTSSICKTVENQNPTKFQDVAFQNMKIELVSKRVSIICYRG